MRIEGNYFIPGLKIYLDGKSSGGVAPPVSDDDWKKKMDKIRADHPVKAVTVVVYNPPEPEPPPTVGTKAKPTPKVATTGSSFVAHLSSACEKKEDN